MGSLNGFFLNYHSILYIGRLSLKIHPIVFYTLKGRHPNLEDYQKKNATILRTIIYKTDI